MTDYQEKINQKKMHLSTFKGFFVALVFVVIISAGANPLSSWFAESGFREGQVKRCYWAAGIKRNMLSYETAAELYSRIIKTFPQKNEAAFYYLAFCLDRKGEKQKAIKAYSEYLNLFPKGDFSIKAQKKLKDLMSLSLKQKF